MSQYTFGSATLLGERSVINRLRKEFPFITFCCDAEQSGLEISVHQQRGVIQIIPAKDYSIKDVQIEDAGVHVVQAFYGFTHSPGGRDDICPAIRLKNQSGGDDVYINLKHVDHLPELNRLHK